MPATFFLFDPTLESSGQGLSSIKSLLKPKHAITHTHKKFKFKMHLDQVFL